MKQIGSVVLAVIFLFSNLGLTFSTHSCGNRIVASSLHFGERDLKCGMKESSEVCENKTGQDVFGQGNCCANTHHILSVDNQILKTIDYEGDESYNSNYCNFPISIITFPKASKSEIQQICYAPPPWLKRDIFITIQSLLL